MFTSMTVMLGSPVARAALAARPPGRGPCLRAARGLGAPSRISAVYSLNMLGKSYVVSSGASLGASASRDAATA